MPIAKYNTIDLALLDLQNGRIDAVASDAPVLRYMTTLSFQGLKTVGEQFTDEKLGIVLAQEQRRSPARRERGALADWRQRRVRARLPTVVRRDARRSGGAAAVGGDTRSTPDWSRAPGGSSCAACG